MPPPKKPKTGPTTADQFLSPEEMQRFSDAKDVLRLPDARQMQLLPDAKEMQRLPDVKELQRLPDAKEMQRLPDAKEMQRLPDAKEMQRLPDAKEMQRLSDEKEMQRLPDAKEMQRLSDAKEMQRLPDAKEMQRLSDAKEMQRLPNAKEMQRLPNVKEMRRLADPMPDNFMKQDVTATASATNHVATHAVKVEPVSQDDRFRITDAQDMSSRSTSANISNSGVLHSGSLRVEHADAPSRSRPSTLLNMLMSLPQTNTNSTQWLQAVMEHFSQRLISPAHHPLLRNTTAGTQNINMSSHVSSLSCNRPTTPPKSAVINGYRCDTNHTQHLSPVDLSSHSPNVRRVRALLPVILTSNLPLPYIASPHRPIPFSTSSPDKPNQWIATSHVKSTASVTSPNKQKSFLQSQNLHAISACSAARPEPQATVMAAKTVVSVPMPLISKTTADEHSSSSTTTNTSDNVKLNMRCLPESRLLSLNQGDSFTELRGDGKVSGESVKSSHILGLNPEIDKENIWEYDRTHEAAIYRTVLKDEKQL